jgi:hypothetical protein
VRKNVWGVWGMGGDMSEGKGGEKHGECEGWEGYGEGKNMGSVGNECDMSERPTLI